MNASDSKDRKWLIITNVFIFQNDKRNSISYVKAMLRRGGGHKINTFSIIPIT